MALDRRMIKLLALLISVAVVTADGAAPKAAGKSVGETTTEKVATPAQAEHANLKGNVQEKSKEKEQQVVITAEPMSGAANAFIVIGGFSVFINMLLNLASARDLLTVYWNTWMGKVSSVKNSAKTQADWETYLVRKTERALKVQWERRLMGELISEITADMMAGAKEKMKARLKAKLSGNQCSSMTTTSVDFAPSSRAVNVASLGV